MNIVVISESDWEDLKIIRVSSLLDAPDAFAVTYEDALSYSDLEWQNLASADGHPRFIIAYEGDIPVGIIGGVFSGVEYELISMWVAVEYRGRSIGSRLIESLKAYAATLGYTEIALDVAIENHSARRLYEKNGFSEIGEAGVLISNTSVKLQKMLWSA